MKSLLAGLALLVAVPAVVRAQPYPPPGYSCDARHGPRGLICPLIRPKPLGMVCHCRPPGPPGYGYGRPVRGYVIR